MEIKTKLLQTIQETDNEELLQKIQMELEKHHKQLPTVFEENNALKQEIVALKNQLHKFLQIISFDLGSPVNSLKSMADLLLMDIQELDNEVVRDTSHFLYEQVEKLQRKMANLILWASFEVKNISPQQNSLDLVEIIQEQSQYYKEAAQQKGIHFLTDLPEKIIFSADKQLIRCLVENLISNAVKFSRKNDKIVVKAQQDDNKISFWVQDTGIGISSAKLGNLFNVARMPQKGTANESGLGLGLVLCQAILKLYNSQLRVQSEKGQATVFSFEISEI